MIQGKTFGFTPLLPRYAEVQTALPLLDGTSKSLVTSMIARIQEQTGTPQNPLDWSDPDAWIPERLLGAERDIANRIWAGSNNQVNPRHFRGAYYLINRRKLLDVDSQGVYRIGERARAFLNDDPEILSELDEVEGLKMLLAILATKSHAKFGDLLPEWSDYAMSRSNYKSDASLRSLLRYSLDNLLHRGLIEREGSTYSISSQGIDLSAHTNASSYSEQTPLHAVTKAIRDYNGFQVSSLKDMLSKMNPYKFEFLIRDLLQAMGYKDVAVTKESGDRGVDVVATVQFGITTITEVVQVKRHQGTITRPTIDQLRGALPYHNAIRGTIITTGSFSSGCAEAALFLGAAPISLIDGDRLEELLIEHEIGIRKRQATLYEVDPDMLAPEFEQEELEDQLT